MSEISPLRNELQERCEEILVQITKLEWDKTKTGVDLMQWLRDLDELYQEHVQLSKSYERLERLLP